MEKETFRGERVVDSPILSSIIESAGERGQGADSRVVIPKLGPMEGWPRSEYNGFEFF
jgi:hypothetical protein